MTYPPCQNSSFRTASEYILGQLLGKSKDEIAELRKEGIMGEESVIPEGVDTQAC